MVSIVYKKQMVISDPQKCFQIHGFALCSTRHLNNIKIDVLCVSDLFLF